MLRDLLDVFKQMYFQEGIQLILDKYVPLPGTYCLVTLMDDGGYSISHTIDIKQEIIDYEKEKYELIKFLDYSSKLISMQKPIDNKKVIHSNNYLSLAVKKENLFNGKFTKEILEQYYYKLLNLEEKYKKPGEKAVYDKTIQEFGTIDFEFLCKIRDITLNGQLWKGINSSDKDYFKIFFILEDEKETKRLYQQECNRYLILNIYNNIFNINDNDILYGAPGNNMNFNPKKPYLLNLSRKVTVPNLLTIEDALIQNALFEYLMGIAVQGKVNIYVNPKDKAIQGFDDTQEAISLSYGYFLRVRKGLELEVLDWDVLPCYNSVLPQKLIVKNKDGSVREYNTLWQVKSLIDGIYFDNKLGFNFFTQSNKLKIGNPVVKNAILKSRKVLFDWFRKGITTNVDIILDQISLEIIKDSIQNNNINKAREQLKLRISLQDYFRNNNQIDEIVSLRCNLKSNINKNIEIVYEYPQEFYFAVGQVTYYLYYIMSLNKLNKHLLYISKVFNSANSGTVKKEVSNLYKMSTAFLPNNKRFNSLLTKIMSYPDRCENNNKNFILAGFLEENLILKIKKNN